MRTSGKYASRRGSVLEYFGANNGLKVCLEQRDTLTDTSGNAKHGTGVDTYTMPTGDAMGYVCSEGATDRYIKVGSLGINQYTSPFTLTAKVTPLDSATYKAFITNGSGAVAHSVYFAVTLRVGPDGDIQFIVEKSQTWSLLLFTIPNVVKPYRESIITATYDGSGSSNGMWVFVNGLRYNSIYGVYTAGTTPTVWDNWNVGVAYVRTPAYSSVNCGEFISRDTAIFNRVLAPQDIIEYQRWCVNAPSKKFFAMNAAIIGGQKTLMNGGLGDHSMPMGGF